MENVWMRLEVMPSVGTLGVKVRLYFDPGVPGCAYASMSSNCAAAWAWVCQLRLVGKVVEVAEIVSLRLSRGSISTGNLVQM